ncbi:MAG: DUF799 domain-containing protein [Rhodospirillales bacterium]|nr:DUF799 domain-containing protein [Rhodospirillales bacterium]
MHWIIRTIALCFVAFAAAGCAAPNHLEFTWKDDQRRVLLMPTDIQLSELNAGGIEMPNAEWTANAEKHFLQSMRRKLAEANSHIIEAQGGFDQPAEQISLIKLHEAVGKSVQNHRPGAILSLPTKAKAEPWTLGPSVNKLKQRYNADYALFVNIRDSYANSERVTAIVIGAMFGVQMQAGVQRGFASLVDLNSGEVVWYGFLARGNGDMRTFEGAQETTDALLKGFPG